MARWAEVAVRETGLTLESYVERFYRETDFLPAIERWTPDLLEEVRGIAEAAGLDFRHVLLRQLSDEEPWYRRELREAGAPAEGCTGIGRHASPAGPAIVAQNMDCGAYMHGLQVVLRVRDPRLELDQLIFTTAGKISLCGMNSRGLAMCCNTLSQLANTRDGLPEDFVVRGFLSRATLAEGLEFLRTIRHASGQNYLVGAPGGRVLDLECSASKVVEYRDVADDQEVMHTNHPLANDDTADFDRRSAGNSPEEKRSRFYGTSYERYAAMRALAGEGPPDEPVFSRFHRMLSSHRGPVCRHGEAEGRGDHFTIGCLLMELGDPPRMHVAPGPPCVTPFHTVDF